MAVSRYAACDGNLLISFNGSILLNAQVCDTGLNFTAVNRLSDVKMNLGEQKRNLRQKQKITFCYT